jgi:pyruvate dehydrogenase E2 component (dihydrolipoamide acetyltransferase)
MHMPKDFKLPDLGEGIHEAQIIKVLVKEGDSVTADQAIMEVETDKAAVELPVPFAGLISKLNVKTGDTVKVGSVLLTIDEGGAAAAKQAPQKAEQPRAQEPPRKAESPLREEAPRNDEAPRKTQAPAAEPDERQQPEKRPQREPVSAEMKQERPVALAEAPRRSEGPIPAAPAVRRYAREQGIDLVEVHGTGPGGRIVREDVERYAISQEGEATGQEKRAARAVDDGGARTTAPSRPAQPSEALPDFSQWGPVRREAIPQIRKAIARAMVRSYTTAVHVTHADEVDVTDLEQFRKEQGAVLADKNAKLTLTAFVVKAVAGALRQFPNFNASFDDATSEMIYKDYVHIGVAVDSPKGLMVPVVRDADRKGLVSISKEIKELADKAREFKLDVAAMRGGSFTVTNVGALGGTMSTPIINYPEVAILGMGKLEWKPVVRNMQIVPRKILPLFLSFDHRVIDGADSARFIRAVMGFLDNPLNLLLV